MRIHGTFDHISCESVGPGSSVFIATRYGVDGPGIESRFGVRYSAPVQTVPGVHLPSRTTDTGSFLGVKWAGRSVNHPPPSNADIKETVELYHSSPLGIHGML
jgi:hypothetical protein